MHPLAQRPPRGRRRRAARESRSRSPRRAGLWARNCGSSRHLRLPLGDRQAQLGVRRHHVALAQRKAAGVERLVHLAREREELRANVSDGRAPSWASKMRPLSWSVPKVCSRRPSLPKASQHQPMLLPAVALALELDDALAQPVVQHRDEQRELLGGDALARPAGARAADTRAASASSISMVAREPDLHGDLAQSQPLQREQVALRDDADERVVLPSRARGGCAIDHRQRRFVGQARGPAARTGRASSPRRSGASRPARARRRPGRAR